MIRAQRRALFVGLILIVACGMLLTSLRHRSAAKPARPDLLLLTSLPLLFGDDFDPRKQGSPALRAFSQRFAVRPISTSSDTELSKGRLLLMAQPPAQAPENLVALDNWVRQGGRVLLLADPMLEWPSARSLGDPLRPPVLFTDTGLLAHWGLRLDTPENRGPADRVLAGRPIGTVSPGSLHGGCDIAPDGFVAICNIGRGRVIVVADADLLNAQTGSEAFSAVCDVLAWLSGNDSQRTDLSTGVLTRTG